MPESLTYLLLLLVWAAPVIALHWLVGARELFARFRLLAVAVLVPTVYLTLADAFAIGSGVWSISDTLTAGVRAGSLVLEEAIFFFLTNLLVAQSIILFLAPSARGRAARLVRRRGRPAAPPPAGHSPLESSRAGEPR
jgi:lycopene beta-cyclase